MTTSNTDHPRHRWTVADYRRMGETGLLNERDRFELINGDILDMATVGCEHVGKVRLLIRLFSALLGSQAIIDVQNPVTLGEDSEPRPDFALLQDREDYYTAAHPEARDVLLLVEVTDPTARFDRRLKLPLYARHGIPEVWLLDSQEQRLEVYRKPVAGCYQRRTEHRSGRLAPRCFPNAAVNLAELLFTSVEPEAGLESLLARDRVYGSPSTPFAGFV